MLVLFFSVHSTVKEGIMRLWSSGESFSPSASFSIHSIDMFVQYLSHGFRIGSIKSNFPFFFLFLFRREWEREERASRWWRKIEGWQSTYRRIIFFSPSCVGTRAGLCRPSFLLPLFFCYCGPASTNEKKSGSYQLARVKRSFLFKSDQGGFRSHRRRRRLKRNQEAWGPTEKKCTYKIHTNIKRRWGINNNKKKVQSHTGPLYLTFSRRLVARSLSFFLFLERYNRDAPTPPPPLLLWSNINRYKQTPRRTQYQFNTTSRIDGSGADRYTNLGGHSKNQFDCKVTKCSNP